MVDEPNPQCPHCIHREVCKNAETYREIVLHISNEVGNMPEWLAYRLACKDFKADQAYRAVENVHRTTVEETSIPEKCLNIPRNYGEANTTELLTWERMPEPTVGEWW